MTMPVRERLYDVDDLWALYCQPGNDHFRFELIDGEISEMSGPGGVHGRIAMRLGRYLDIFAEENNLGIVTGEAGYYSPDDRYTTLFPDVATISFERAPDPFPEWFVPAMPDLAVEVKSPGNTWPELRDKARRYLQRGKTLVWIVDSARGAVEIHRTSGTVEAVSAEGSLAGGEVLPGFTLELSRLFS